KISAQDRDTIYRILTHASALEVAHFVPVADEKWFASNKMDQYVINLMTFTPADSLCLGISNLGLKYSLQKT
ncbi:uncharacterized protein F5Z01DRAFT_631444, partial [Emericellopsis atlantica]